MKLPIIDRWARGSQQGACRNAMVASTEALRRRVERDEVAAYVAAVADRHGHPEPPLVEEVVAAVR
jgi:hypothetical protein